MKNKIIDSFLMLKQYCEDEKFMGWDPYDGLNSKIFQATPLKSSKYARMIWIQVFKKSKLNLRKLFLVPKGYNSKGIALLLNGYCNLYYISKKNDSNYFSQEEILYRINELAKLLLKLKNTQYGGAGWGYNFDWQSRAFFLPYNTPTVVATSFVVESLINAYEITHNNEYLDTALLSGDFVINALNRIEKSGDNFMFSYSPLDNRAVYNATLLGSKILAQVYHYTKNEDLKSFAYKSIKAVCEVQNVDGSFPHSDQVGQKWRDSFHTGFKLESIFFYQKYCEDTSFQVNLDKGFDYWITNYFNHENGFCFYFDRGFNTSLVDLHCAAQAITTLVKLNKSILYKDLMKKIIDWSVNNMQHNNGYFFFQMQNGLKNKNQFMRWPNAWMFYGISYYLTNINLNDKY
jgi:hypothetical protein